MVYDRGERSLAGLICPGCKDHCRGWTNMGNSIRCITCGEEMMDTDNWAVLGEKIALRPIGNRILILEDKFKTGLECKTCNGDGHTEEVCNNCKGTKFEEAEQDGQLVQYICRACSVGQAGGKIAYGKKLCPSCSGRQALIIIPDENKRRPTTGKVLAVGPLVKQYKVGGRVLYTNYTGSEFDMEGFALRVMAEQDVLCEAKFMQSVELNEHTDVVESGVV